MSMNFRYYKTSLLITAIILSSIAMDGITVKLIIPLAETYLENFRAPTTSALVIMLLTCYNQYLWRFPILNKLVKVPDMGGRYKGKISYEFQGVPGEKDCAVEVKQNASSVKIQLYTTNDNNEKTSSQSLVEDIQLTPSGFFEVYYFYLNSGTKMNGGLDCHEGAKCFTLYP